MYNKVLVFDVKSKLAHFRKINTNSSSLTYLVPPRTTIMGLVAGILGRERDSYYTDESFSQMYIGVAPMNEHRINTQSINYLSIKSTNDVIGYNNHTQIPVEFLTSSNDVCFRVYLSCEEELFAEIKTALVEERYVYLPSLGLAYCLADIDYIGDFEISIIDNLEDTFVDINTVTRVEHINGFDFSPNIYKEKMPYKFKANRICLTNDYIFSRNHNTIKLKISKGNLYSINIDNKEELFTFM